MRTIYISIGNSDDKLTQQQWSNYVADVDKEIRAHAIVVHGEWYSVPSSPYQNACWCAEILDAVAVMLMNRLRLRAWAYMQDSITWMQGEPMFLTPRDPEEDA